MAANDRCTCSQYCSIITALNSFKIQAPEKNLEVNLAPRLFLPQILFNCLKLKKFSILQNQLNIAVITRTKKFDNFFNCCK